MASWIQFATKLEIPIILLSLAQTFLSFRVTWNPSSVWRSTKTKTDRTSTQEVMMDTSISFTWSNSQNNPPQKIIPCVDYDHSFAGTLPLGLSSSAVDLSLAVPSHYWNAESGDNESFSGKGHTNQVSSMAISENDELVTCGMDDTLRFTSLSKKEYRSAYSCAVAIMLTSCV